MKRLNGCVLILCMVLMMSIISGNSFAMIIPIANSDFEATTPESAEWVNVWDDIANGQEWGRYQAGWNDDHNVGWAAGTYGQTLAWAGEHNWVTDTLFPGVSMDSYGSQVAYFYNGGGYSQDLSATVSAGTYVIEFDMGRSEDTWCFFNLQLYAGTQDNVIITAQYDTPDGGTDPDLSNGYGLADVPVHGWTHQTVTFVIDETNPNIGSTLGIGFAGDKGVTLDNISIAFTPVPEPATMLLLGIGSIFVCRRYDRAS